MSGMGEETKVELKTLHEKFMHAEKNLKEAFEKFLSQYAGATPLESNPWEWLSPSTWVDSAITKLDISGNHELQEQHFRNLYLALTQVPNSKDSTLENNLINFSNYLIAFNLIGELHQKIAGDTGRTFPRFYALYTSSVQETLYLFKSDGALFSKLQEIQRILQEDLTKRSDIYSFETLIPELKSRYFETLIDLITSRLSHAATLFAPGSPKTRPTEETVPPKLKDHSEEKNVL